MEDSRVNGYVKVAGVEKDLEDLDEFSRRYLDVVGRSAEGLYLFKGDEMKFAERAGENLQRR